jgi:hypothetical protein
LDAKERDQPCGQQLQGSHSRAPPFECFAVTMVRSDWFGLSPETYSVDPFSKSIRAAIALSVASSTSPIARVATIRDHAA